MNNWKDNYVMVLFQQNLKCSRNVEQYQNITIHFQRSWVLFLLLMLFDKELVHTKKKLNELFLKHQGLAKVEWLFAAISEDPNFKNLTEIQVQAKKMIQKINNLLFLRSKMCMMMISPSTLLWLRISNTNNAKQLNSKQILQLKHVSPLC